jgi:hypothetical protein
MNNPTHCAWCGAKFPDPPKDFGPTGYAIIPMTKETVCYACADRWTREQMLASDKFGVYLSSDGKTLTTWTGGELARVTDEWKSSGGGFHFGPLTHVRAIAPDGSLWYGKGSGRGMCLTIHRQRSGRKSA